MRHQHLINSRRTYKTRYPGKDIPKTLHVPPSRFRANFFSRNRRIWVRSRLCRYTHHATIIRFSLFQLYQRTYSLADFHSADTNFFCCKLNRKFSICVRFLPLFILGSLATSRSFSTALARLPLTWWRLHAGGGSTKVRAGDELPNSHKTVCGNTPPLA